MIEKIGAVGIGSTPSVGGVTSNKPSTEAPGSGPSFGQLIGAKLGEANSLVPTDLKSRTEGLRFSNHALERMSSRGISFRPDELTKFNDAISRAEAKGSREALVLMGNNAFIVSVKNKTVVTAMDREMMKENVFTNIDSTVIV